MDKYGKMGTGWKVTMGIAIAILAIFVVLPAFGVGQTQTGSSNTPVVCDSTTTPSLTISAYDKENVGTALTEATNIYREKGTNTWTTFTAGTGFDVGAGKVLEVVMGVDTTDFVDNAYGQSFELTVPCEENPTVEKEMVNDELEGSVTATFYNADSNAAGEGFSAGESQVVSIKMKAGNDEYYGNPYLPTNRPNLLILHLNTTTWDKPNSVYLADGTELQQVDTPNRFGIEQTLTGRTAYAYEFPVVTDKQIEVFLDLNADDTTAPAVDDTAYLYAGGWYINSDTGALEYGIDTEDNADVATSDPDSITLDFTA